MAIARDERDILDVFLIANLAQITQNSALVTAPLGMQNFIDTITVDNVMNLTFPADVRNLLVNYILTNQILRRPRVKQSPIIASLAYKKFIL